MYCWKSAGRIFGRMAFHHIAFMHHTSPAATPRATLALSDKLVSPDVLVEERVQPAADAHALHKP